MLPKQLTHTALSEFPLVFLDKKRIHCIAATKKHSKTYTISCFDSVQTGYL